MPEIKPFAALRYNPDNINLADVVVPPYDVIKDKQREKLAAQPYSGVRLTLIPEEPTDTPESNRYTRSRDLFEEWRRDGVLVQDEEPSLYVLRQDFTWDGTSYTRMHLVCACKLYEFSDKVILPHEQILQGPKDDRQRLIETTRANYEPLFGLTMGDSADFRALLDEHAQGEPIEDVTLENGERNRVWRISDPAAIHAFEDSIARKTVVIADGHHRYNASLGVKRDLNAKDGPGPWDYAMMTLAAMDDPKLLVLPTHRMVAGLENYDEDEIISRLGEFFRVEEKGSPEDVLAAMESEDGVAIGMLAEPDASYVLIPHAPDKVASMIQSDHSPEWKALDVSVLHGLIMDRVLGIGAGESPHISYTRDAREAAQSVHDEAQLAFLLKDTPAEAVRTISLLGETMPQKSTYFYPKLLTGLLIRKW
jgi:uncharacterized protein (DUF1015 family)